MASRGLTSLQAVAPDKLDRYRGIHFWSLTEGIATTGPIGKAMLTVMSAFA